MYRIWTSQKLCEWSFKLISWRSRVKCYKCHTQMKKNENRLPKSTARSKKIVSNFQYSSFGKMIGRKNWQKLRNGYLRNSFLFFFEGWKNIEIIWVCIRLLQNESRKLEIIEKTNRNRRLKMKKIELLCWWLRSFIKADISATEGKMIANGDRTKHIWIWLFQQSLYWKK